MGSPPILATSAAPENCKQRGRPVNVLSNAVGLSMLRFASGDTAWLQIEMTITLIGASLVQINFNIDRPPASSAVTEVNIDEGRWTSEPRDRQVLPFISRNRTVRCTSPFVYVVLGSSAWLALWHCSPWTGTYLLSTRCMMCLRTQSVSMGVGLQRAIRYISSP